MKSLRFSATKAGLLHISSLVISLLVLLFSLTPKRAEAANCISAGTGTWTAITWTNCAGGPTATDTVTIRNGDTVTLNASPTITALTVGQGASGTLTMGDSNTNRTLTVTGNIAVSSGGTFNTAGNGGNALIIGGNMTNAGTFDMRIGASTADTTFNGVGNQTLSGAGGTTDFNNITINNTGAANNNIVEIASTIFTAPAGFLTLTRGVLKMSGTYIFSNTFFSAAAYTIPANGGLWLNNANVTVTAQAADATLTGLLRITTGIYNIGTANTHELIYTNNSSLTMEGGVLNIAASLRPSAAGSNAITFNMSGGTLTVATVGATSAIYNTFDIDNAASSFTMSGGTIVLQQGSSAASDYRNVAGTVSITGGTLQVGNASTATGQLFGIGPLTPGGPANVLPSLTVNSTNSPTAVLQAAATVYGNVTINSGATLTAISIGGGAPSQNLSLSGNWTNNGTFTSGTGTVTFNGAAAQSIGGSSATSFYALTLSPTVAGTTISETTNINVSNTMTVNANAVFTPDAGVVINSAAAAGTITGSGTIKVTRTAATADYSNQYKFTTNTLSSVTVDYAGSGAQTVNAYTYGALKTSGSGEKTTSSGTTTVNGALTVNSGTTLLAKAAGSTITLNSTLVNNGAFVIDANGNGCKTADTKITVNGTATWSGGGSYQLSDITISGQNASGYSPSLIAVYNGINGGSNSGFSFVGDCTGAPAAYPTAVKLISFTATNHSDKVLIKWRTGHEVNNLGFNLYREEGGQLYRLTPELVAGSALIAGSGIALTAGRTYTWWDDSSLSPAKYWLEDVDLSGKRAMYGPITPVLAEGPAPRGEQAALLSKLTKAQSEKDIATSASQSLQARVSKTASAGAFQSFALGAAQTPQQVQWALAGASAVKIFVQKEGWYRVNQPELAAYGLGTADPRYLQLYVNGQEVPMVVNGQADGNFGLLDSIEFYGKGLDTLYTDAQTYWLVVGSRLGKRIPQVVGGLRNKQSLNFPFTVEAKPREIYFPALFNGGGNKFFGPLISADPSNPTVLKLNVLHSDPVPSGKAVLEVVLQGVLDGGHTVSVLLNNYPVGQVTFSGDSQGTAKVEFTQAGLVQEGENQVQLVALGGDMDLSLVDTVRLTYWHTYMADDDILRFTAFGGGQLSIGGFSASTIRVMDITDPNEVSEVKGTVKPGSPPYIITISVPGRSTRTMMVFTDAQIMHPVVTANNPSKWHPAANWADMVVISHSDFLGALEPLKTFREGQGLSVALIDVEDLYDEFNFGNKTPQAIQDFLRIASTSWKKHPRFVLLMGDASADPRNYLGYGNFDLVPTKQIEMKYTESASDDWFSDFNGAGLPWMAMGRIPVRSSAEATTVITKILNYEQSSNTGEWTKKALMVSDIGDPADFVFEAATNEVGALLPGTITVTKIYRSVFPDDASASIALIAGIDQGALLVNYMGHGSEVSWRGDILTATEADALTNGLRLPFFINMTCWNGWFTNFYTDTLAESLLKAGQGGAVAVWASSGLTEPNKQLVMDKALIPLLFNGQSLTIGEATKRAKAAVGDMDVRRTWILFGDPSLRLK